ncbi:ABC transporter permease [Candidatus Gottesmanbacteria bacterium]|nr:ABC transporter permease [Candidatus Gottesmanbacteria bacterium]
MKWHRIKAVMRRHLLIWPRNLDQITDIFWWPVLELLTWGLFTVYLTKNNISSPSLVTFLLGGVMFWSVITQSQQQTSLIFMRDAWDRNLLNIFATPITIWEYFLGGLLVSMIKFIISFIILFVLGYILYAFNIFSLGWYFLPFMFNLSLFGWAIGLFVTGFIVRYGWRVSSFAWTIISIFQPFSAVFYPLSTLPNWAQKIGLLFPSTYIFEGMRSVFLTETMKANYLIISFGLNLVYFVLALLFYRWMFKVALEKGLLIKFV